MPRDDIKSNQYNMGKDIKDMCTLLSDWDGQKTVKSGQNSQITEGAFTKKTSTQKNISQFHWFKYFSFFL